MSQRRVVYAARFLRPPGWTKRLLLREKPRELTGPYENPVRRWVRLREKARQFSELPPPRRVPVPKPARRRPLASVEGVPRVSPEVLQRRLDFLLSPLAVEAQLAAPLRPGLSPYDAEVRCWERQMREIRRIYRAQYLQRLAEVTETERQNEDEIHQRILEERRRRKQAHLQRIGEDMKRRAILADRKRIEEKVEEAITMARRSKLKRRRLYWFRRVENLSKLIVSAENFEAALPPAGGVAAAAAGREPGGHLARSPKSNRNADGGSIGAAPTATGVLLSRNVSVPFLLRQLGGATGHPKQKSRRMPHVDNVQRELQELSYDVMPEDESRFAPEPSRGPGHRERATQLYGSFSQEEKVALLDQKISMLRRKIEDDERKGEPVDRVAQRILEEMDATRMAKTEGEEQRIRKAAARAARGEDPVGLPSWRGGDGGGGGGGL